MVSHCDLVTDFVPVILSQSEGSGKMALGIGKYAYDRSSKLIGIIWFAVSLSWSVVVDPYKHTFVCKIKLFPNHKKCTNEYSAFIFNSI